MRSLPLVWQSDHCTDHVKVCSISISVHNIHAVHLIRILQFIIRTFRQTDDQHFRLAYRSSHYDYPEYLTRNCIGQVKSLTWWGDYAQWLVTKRIFYVLNNNRLAICFTKEIPSPVNQIIYDRLIIVVSQLLEWSKLDKLRLTASTGKSDNQSIPLTHHWSFP